MKHLPKINFRAFLLVLKNFFSNNLLLKLVSLLSALIIWTYIVDSTPSLTRTKYVEGLSVSVSGASSLNSQGLALATDVYTDYINKISAEVEVSQNQFSKVASSNVGIILDLSNVRSAGVHELSLSAVSVYGEVTHIYPETISVQIDNYDSREVPIDAVLTGIQKDGLWYSIDHDSMNPQQITISGPASLVHKAANVTSHIDITNQTSSFRRASLLTILDSEGQALNTRLLSRSSSTCSASVDIYPTKELGIFVDTSELNVREGYTIESISFQPSTITVAADQTLLDELESLPIELPENMPESEKTFTKRLALSRLSELKYVSTRQVYMTVSIAEEKDTNAINNIPLHGISLSDGYSASISPNAFSVQVTGARSQIASLTANDIYAYVDLTGLTAGTYELPIVIGNNPHFSYASLSPSLAKVVITEIADGDDTATEVINGAE